MPPVEDRVRERRDEEEGDGGNQVRSGSRPQIRTQMPIIKAPIRHTVRTETPLTPSEIRHLLPKESTEVREHAETGRANSSIRSGLMEQS